MRSVPSISIVVPVHNGGDAFRQCLISLFNANPRPDEIIVVANGDSDGSSALARKFGARVLRLPKAVGPARARNIGALCATGDFVFFVDADVTIPLDAVEQVKTAFAQDSDLAAIFGSYDDAPAALNFLSQYKNLLHHYIHQTSDEQACTFWGACGAIRRTAFLEVGGFDERYRLPSIEDIELGYRLTKRRYRIRLCKQLQVKHLKHWRWHTLLKAEVWQRAVPWTELILRDGRFLNDLNLRTSQRVSVMLAYGIAAAAMAGWWWPGFLALAAAEAVALLSLNAHLYSFFASKRGLWFAAQTIPWHWLYFFYSGMAFSIGMFRHAAGKGVSTPVPALENK
jgi:glycosyltransferase involved in cell wall biosynthesis